MKNYNIKKGDLVKGIIKKGIDFITIDYPLKVWSKYSSDGIIVEIPKDFFSLYITPWTSEYQSLSIITVCGLLPDKRYYYFDNWILLKKRMVKMNI